MKIIIVFFAGMLSNALLAVDSVPVITVSVIQPGIYASVTGERASNPNLVTPRLLEKDIKLVAETNQITAAKGVKFGFLFHIDGGQKDKKYPIKEVVIFPGNGVQPTNETTVLKVHANKKHRNA